MKTAQPSAPTPSAAKLGPTVSVTPEQLKVIQEVAAEVKGLHKINRGLLAALEVIDEELFLLWKQTPVNTELSSRLSTIQRDIVHPAIRKAKGEL